MKKILLLSAVVAGLLLPAVFCFAEFETRIPPYLIAKGLEGNPLFKLGYLDVTLYGADPTGQRDSTKAIQAAVDDAREYHLVTFFPHQVDAQGRFRKRGEYLISKTIDCRMWSWSFEGYGRKSNILTGSKKGGIRPLIRLTPNAAAFGNIEDPQPMFWFWSVIGGFMKKQDLDQDGIFGRCRKEDKGAYYYDGHYYCDRDDILIYDAQLSSGNPLDSDTDISFDQVFRGIDLDLGGNPGAIGLKNAGAQGQSIEDTTINATGAYAGIGNIGGLGTAEYNINIIGGRYGIYLDSLKNTGDKYLPQATLVGITFIDQEEAVIRIAGRVTHPFAIIGFDIRNNGHVPVAVGQVYPGSGGILMVDGAIRTQGQSLFDIEGLGLYLRNVYVRGAKHVAASLDIKHPEQWTRIQEYALPDQGFVSMMDGKKVTGEIRGKLERVDAAGDRLAASLRDFHSYGLDGFPSFEDMDAVNVKDLGAAGDGETDDTRAIQKAIDHHQKVFLPKGHYRIGNTVRLKADTKFFGVSKKNTIISPMGSWKPGVVTTMVTTEDSADGTAILADLLIGNHGTDFRSNNIADTYEDKKTRTKAHDQFRFSMVEWKVGRHSVMRDINAGSVGAWIDEAKGEMRNDGHRFVVTGNGGGHWYGVRAQHRGQAEKTPNLLIQNSDAPMVIYPINLHSASFQVNIDVRGSRNKIFYYPQQEGGVTHIRISDSENIAIYGAHKNTINDKGPDRGCFEIINSQNILIAVSNAPESKMGNANRIYEVHHGRTYKITGSDVTLFKRGDPSFPFTSALENPRQ